MDPRYQGFFPTPQHPQQPPPQARNPYLQLQTDLPNRPVRPFSQGAPLRPQNSSPRVSKAMAVYGQNQSREPSKSLGSPVRPKSTTQQRQDWEGGDGGSATYDTLLGDLREAKKIARDCKVEVLQLRAENSRLMHTLKEQDRTLLRLGSAADAYGGGAMTGPPMSPRFESTAEEARKLAEKNTLVRQLKAQILQLRQDCADKDAELHGLQRKLKANYLAELSAEKEEYFLETLRLRHVISSLRRDMAAELMHRGNPKVEAQLREQIARLTAGFRDSLWESNGPSVGGGEQSAASNEALQVSMDKMRQRAIRLRQHPSPSPYGIPSAVAWPQDGPSFDVPDETLTEAHGEIRGSGGSASEGARKILSTSGSRSQSQSQPPAATTAEVGKVDAAEGKESESIAEEPTVQSPRPFLSSVSAEPRAASANEVAAIAAAVQVFAPVYTTLDDSGAAAMSANVLDASSSSSKPATADKKNRMDEKQRVMLMQQMRDTFRRLLSGGSFKVDELFDHLDEDGDGELTAPEIFEGLSSVPGFEEVNEEQVVALVRTTTGDTREWISMEEFKDFVKSESKNGQSLSSKEVRRPRRQSKGSRTSRSSGVKKGLGAAASAAAAASAVASRMTSQSLPAHATPAEFAAGVLATFKKTVQDGFSLDELFAEMDADGDGQISADELQAILVRFRYFKSVTVKQVDSLLTAIHEHQEGDVSIEEFKAFLAREERNAAAITLQMAMRRSFPNKHRFAPRKPVKPQKKKSSKNDSISSSSSSKDRETGALASHKDSEFVAKCRGVFRRMVKSGTSVETLFSQIDLDGDGSLTVDELQVALARHPVFHVLASGDVASLVKIIDEDGDGEVDMQEFKHFVQNEKKHAAATALQAQLRRRYSTKGPTHHGHSRKSHLEVGTDDHEELGQHHKGQSHSPKASTSKGSPFVVGCRCEAQFGGGEKWYPATVQGVSGNGLFTFSLLYDDGDTENEVPLCRVRTQTLTPSSPGEGSGTDNPLPRESSVYSDDFEN